MLPTSSPIFNGETDIHTLVPRHFLRPLISTPRLKSRRRHHPLSSSGETALHLYDCNSWSISYSYHRARHYVQFTTAHRRPPSPSPSHEEGPTRPLHQIVRHVGFRLQIREEFPIGKNNNNTRRIPCGRCRCRVVPYLPGAFMHRRRIDHERVSKRIILFTSNK